MIANDVDVGRYYIAQLSAGECSGADESGSVDYRYARVDFMKLENADDYVTVCVDVKIPHCGDGKLDSYYGTEASGEVCDDGN